jgi:hypothetical protein
VSGVRAARDALHKAAHATCGVQCSQAPFSTRGCLLLLLLLLLLLRPDAGKQVLL